ncbi:hypothetical protein UCRPC4_g04859 [Phaeomoniella chlamydospora]|uniref:Uncharacterized protein n=1 Tax=Phaeomoniella chlamydospora TaxID=158046 RepID=A0A0G2G4H9_PHACM|nr:hypothetical protein UCRPC4_g04859 [Phaeomoniella chlamydospora]
MTSPLSHDRRLSASASGLKISMRDVVVKYMCTQLDGSVHKALDPNAKPAVESKRETVVKKQRSLLNFDEIYADSKAAQQKFIKEMQDFKQKANDAGEPIGKDIDVAGDHDWDQVLQIVDSANDEYKKKASKGRLGRAADKLGEVREEIAEAVEEIPGILSNTKVVAELYADQEAVHRAASALYVSVIGILQYILVWFKQKAIDKFFKAAIGQDAYKKELQLKTSDLKKKMEHFNKQAVTSQMRHVKQVREDVMAVKEVQGQQIEQTATVISKIDALNAEMMLLKSRLEDSIVRPHLLGVFEENTRRRRVCNLSAEDILQDLELDASTVKPPLDELLLLPSRLTPVDQNRAMALMRESQLKDWVTSEDSSVLLIHGLSIDETQSPLTLVCALLIDTAYKTIAKADSFVVPLCFFCGEHLDLADDEEAHPQGMILTLIAQLLFLYSDFNFLPIEKLWKKFKPNDIRSICRLFEALILQLPAHAKVFIIIDAISYYEDRTRREAAVEAVNRLVGLARRKDDGKSPIVKILMTSPSSCNYVYESFDSDEILTMQRQYPPQVGYKYADRYGSVGRDIEVSILESAGY